MPGRSRGRGRSRSSLFGGREIAFEGLLQTLRRLGQAAEAAGVERLVLAPGGGGGVRHERSMRNSRRTAALARRPTSSGSASERLLRGNRGSCRGETHISRRASEIRQV